MGGGGGRNRIDPSLGNGTSCSFDYISTDWNNRIYLIVMYIGGFFLPLGVSIFCYARMFATVKANNAIEQARRVSTVSAPNGDPYKVFLNASLKKCPGRGKIGKIWKISGEKLFFFTANFVHSQLIYNLANFLNKRLVYVISPLPGDKVFFSPHSPPDICNFTAYLT